MQSSTITQLVNAYKGAITKAEKLHARYMTEPSIQLLADESLCYKNASEICGKLASAYVSQPTIHDDWLEKQRRADHQIRVLVSIATNEPLPEYTPVFADVPPAPRRTGGTKNPKLGGADDKEQTETETTESGSTGKTTKSGGKQKHGDEVSEETVKTWIHDDPPDHGFEAVAGMEDLIKQLRSCLPDEAADKVKDHMGVSNITGIFLYGPPGCGKTFCIEAFIHELMTSGMVEEEADTEEQQEPGKTETEGADDQTEQEEAPKKKYRYTYMSLSGGDIHDKYVGGAERRVKRAFQEAEKRAPCILFIDEIENVCRNRSEPNLPGHAWATTAEFLNSYNHLISSHKKVIFIGATNYPNMVEGAMRDRVKLIQVPLPDVKARQCRFEQLLRSKDDDKKPRLILEPGFDTLDMAKATINYSYRDFGHLIEELTAAMYEEMIPIYGKDGDAMVRAMETGEYPLRRDLFMKVLANYVPSKKDEMIRTLDAWTNDISHEVAGNDNN